MLAVIFMPKEEEKSGPLVVTPNPPPKGELEGVCPSLVSTHPPPKGELERV